MVAWDFCTVWEHVETSQPRSHKNNSDAGYTEKHGSFVGYLWRNFCAVQATLKGTCHTTYIVQYSVTQLTFHAFIALSSRVLDPAPPTLTSFFYLSAYMINRHTSAQTYLLCINAVTHISHQPACTLQHDSFLWLSTILVCLWVVACLLKLWACLPCLDAFLPCLWALFVDLFCLLYTFHWVHYVSYVSFYLSCYICPIILLIYFVKPLETNIFYCSSCMHVVHFSVKW